MEYIIGTALLVGAFFIVGAARRFFEREHLPRWAAGFGAGEGLALAVTTMIAGGIAFLAGRVYSDIEGGRFLELAIAAACIAASVYAVRRFAGRTDTLAAGPVIALDVAGVEGPSLQPTSGPAAPANANRRRKAARKKAA